jgi:glucuronate isomerase
LTRDSGQHSFPVVLAHAACEWATEDALRRLLNHKGLADDVAAPILRAFTTTSLTDKRVRQLFKAMTGASPGDETWWQAFEESRHLRNQVAHRGFAASSDQALEALSLAESCIAFIMQAIEKVIGT